MIRNLDIPTWFLTLSPADMHWPEIIQAIGIQFSKRFTREEVIQMNWETKSNYLRSNPITTCRMFQFRVESFFSEYILSSDNPLGEIHDYVIKIEFQERGAPHAHCLLWAKMSLEQMLTVMKMYAVLLMNTFQEEYHYQLMTHTMMMYVNW